MELLEAWRTAGGVVGLALPRGLGGGRGLRAAAAQGHRRRGEPHQLVGAAGEVARGRGHRVTLLAAGRRLPRVGLRGSVVLRHRRQVLARGRGFPQEVQGQRPAGPSELQGRAQPVGLRLHLLARRPRGHDVGGRLGVGLAAPRDDLVEPWLQVAARALCTQAWPFGRGQRHLRRQFRRCGPVRGPREPRLGGGPCAGRRHEAGAWLHHRPEAARREVRAGLEGLRRWPRACKAGASGAEGRIDHQAKRRRAT
mmetsp:Transcript_83805/g.242019  ORF Transcript_83805/g.242019 Transcript_83805/m.242019 type:complete len:253 (+) Transcript_83805:357-1115(+)